MFTTDRAAAELGVSSTQVRQVALDGTIEALKFGRDLLITAAALERAKKRKTKPGPVPKPKEEKQRRRRRRVGKNEWRMEEVLKDQTERAYDILIGETAQCVRRYPLSALAAAFGGGVLAGWLIARNLKTQFYAGRKERQRASETKANQRAISVWENEGGAYRG
jgi:excisionase family DNA binding protein